MDSKVLARIDLRRSKFWCSKYRPIQTPCHVAGVVCMYVVVYAYCDAIPYCIVIWVKLNTKSSYENYVFRLLAGFPCLQVFQSISKKYLLSKHKYYYMKCISNSKQFKDFIHTYKYLHIFSKENVQLLLTKHHSVPTPDF